MFHEHDRRVELVIPIVLLEEPVPLVFCHHEPHRRIVLPRGRHDLLGFRIWNSWGVLSLDHEEGFCDLIGVGQWRNLHEKFI